MIRSAVVVLAISLWLAGEAFTQEDEPYSYWRESWTCGQVVVPERRMIELFIKENALRAYTVGNNTLPLLIANLPERTGTLVFVERNGQWESWPVADGHSVWGVYSTPAYNRFMLFTLWSVESPGHSYTILRANQQLAQIDCLEMEFPAEVDQLQLESMSIADFNIQADGRGVLIGDSNRYQDNIDSPEERWFAYQTADWGKTWSLPVPVQKPVSTLPGVFRPAKAVAPDQQQIDSLLRQAR